MKFKSWNVCIEKHEYGNGRTALVLVDSNNGETIAVATVNLPDLPNHFPGIKKELLFIKDWAENEGMVKALVEGGMVHAIGQSVPVSEFVRAAVVTMTDELEEM